MLLIGDAAHVHSPAGGQGTNTGIEDAIVLGQLLADVVVGVRDETALDVYDELRRPAASEVLALADRLTTLATVQSPLMRLLRNAFLRIIDALPFVKRRIELGLSGLSRADFAQVPVERKGSLPAPRQRTLTLYRGDRAIAIGVQNAGG